MIAPPQIINTSFLKLFDLSVHGFISELVGDISTKHQNGIKNDPNHFMTIKTDFKISTIPC